jgi:signal transduction histidine kinase
LGLVSMQERVHLMNGTFLVKTKANHGTKVVASVPWIGDNGGFMGQGCIGGRDGPNTNPAS